MYRVTQAAFDQVAALLKDSHIRREVFLRPLTASFPAVSHSSDNDLRALALQNIFRVAGTHVSHADDAKTYFFHIGTPFKSVILL